MKKIIKDEQQYLLSIKWDKEAIRQWIKDYYKDCVRKNLPKNVIKFLIEKKLNRAMIGVEDF